MNNKIKEYSNEVSMETKKLMRNAPRDEIDWALLMYLFRYSKPRIGGLFEEKNVITMGKISRYFNLKYSEVYTRLQRMMWWVNVNTVYGYYKSFNICSITPIAIKFMMKSVEIFKE